MNRIKRKFWLGPVVICLPLLLTILVQVKARRDAVERRHQHALNIAKQTSTAKHPLLPNGIYVGLEPLPNLSPEEAPDAKWYHLNTLSLHEASVTIEEIPVWDRKGKRTYSASDGGFLTYKGRVELRPGGMVLHLKMTESDYVATGPGFDPNWIPTVKVNKDGSLTVNRVVYHVRRKTD
ncbi:MAG: hypothetical protein JWL77_3190 [Chthonomonadaceae bacterium]|nr:hypothetical protein [Chthonomonadaceae bacterium]